MSNVRGHYVRGVSGWRKIAAVGWAPPDKGVIHGSLEIDIGPGLDYIARYGERAGVKITVTHLVVKALGETLRRHPECNGMIRRNKIYERETVDISVLVAVKPDHAAGERAADLSETIIRNADSASLAEIASTVQKGALAIRRHEDFFVETTKKMFRKIPSTALKYVLRATARLEYNWNLDMTRLGVPRDPFGSLIVTSVGSLGIGRAYAPIPPFSFVPVVIAIGRIEEKPVVRDGKIVARQILPLNATIDHRLIDGYQATRMAASLQAILENPEAELGGH